MGKTLQVLADRASDEKKLAQLGELADGRFRDLRNPPSLQALKLHQLMFKAAGGAVAEDRWHQISLAEIRAVPGIKHHDRRSLLNLLAELRGVVIEYDDDRYTNIVGILDIARVEFEAATGGLTMMKWKFGEGFRDLAAKSDYYAIIDRQTTFAMTSRYSLRLFEMMSVRANLAHKTSETFTIADLRGRLGVTEGKLVRWTHFDQKVLRPAIAEVNQLARFTVTATPRKSGRNVVAVELAWALKDDLSATKTELRGHSVGRKARREGSVETVTVEPPKPPVAFPADGSISYGPWAEIARKHLPHPTPDIDLIASAFRKARHAANRPLDGRDVEGHFVNFCKAWQSRA